MSINPFDKAKDMDMAIALLKDARDTCNSEHRRYNCKRVRELLKAWEIE